MKLSGCNLPFSCIVMGLPLLLRNEGSIVIGERVSVNSLDYLYRYGNCPKTKLSTGFGGEILIGDDSSLNGVSILAEKEVRIGKRVLIASGVKIIDSNVHPVNEIPRRYSDIKEIFPVIIEDDVWIAMDVIVLPGVRIGRGSVIGAGSVVSSDIPEYTLAVGQPARVIRKLRMP